MRKFLNIVFSLIWISIILGGLVLELTDVKLGDIAEENRTLAELPEVPNSFETLEQFPTQFEDYVSDNFSLRPLLLKFWNTILIKTRQSPVEKVYVGKNGWFFNNYNDAINQYRGISRMNLESYVSKLQEDVEYIRDKGIPFIYFIAPNKLSIYPEHVDARVINEDVDYKRLHDTLEVLDLDMDIINLKELFYANKDNGHLLYSPYGSHWNNYGGLLAFNEVIKKTQKYMPDVDFIDESRFRIKKCTGEVGLLRQLNAYNLEPDTINTCITIRQPHRKKVHKLKKVHIHASSLKNGIKVLIIGDSFNLHLTQFYKEVFEQVIFTAHNFGNWDLSLVDKYKPDLVIYGMVERTLTKKNAKEETMFSFDK